MPKERSPSGYTTVVFVNSHRGYRFERDVYIRETDDESSAYSTEAEDEETL